MSSSPGQGIRQYIARNFLGLLALLVFLCSVAAIAVDDLPSQPADSVAGRAATFSRALLGTDPEGFKAVTAADKIPPLPIVIPGMLLALLGNTLFALRLAGVLILGILMIQCYDLARRCGASRHIAQWAALLCGTTPMLFGWSRLAYADIFVAVFHVACLQVMARGNLTPRRALILGLMGGLGVLSKLSFFVYMLGPAVFFLVAHLRQGRGQLLNLGLMVMSAAAVAGWWIAMRFTIIYENFFHSTQAWSTEDSFMFGGQDPVDLKLHQLGFQLWQHPGLPLLWLGAAAGLVLWRKEPLSQVRSLLGLGSLLCLGSLMLFDPGSRYLVPLMPPAAVLMALAVERLLRLGRQRFKALEPVMCMALLAWFVSMNLVHLHDENLRFNSVGMMAPLRGYMASCKEINSKRSNLSILYVEAATEEWLVGFDDEAGRHCNYPKEKPDATKPCQLYITLNWLKEDLNKTWKTPKPGICPDLGQLNRFGDKVNLRFRVITPHFYLRPGFTRAKQVP